MLALLALIGATLSPVVSPPAGELREVRSLAGAQAATRLAVPCPEFGKAAYRRRTDELVGQARRLGVRVILMVGANCGDGRPADPPADPAAFGRFAARAVRRWRPAALEVWNEPNHPGFWSGTVEQYAGLVRAVQRRVSGVPVVMGSLALDDTDYLQRLYDAGARADGVSVHPYPIEMAGATFRFVGGARAVESVERVRAVMLRNGDTTPVYVTELGYPSCPVAPVCVDELTKSAGLVAAVRGIASKRYVRATLVYSIRDWTTGWDGRFGLIGPDGPRPAFAALRHAIGDLAKR